MSRIGQVRDWVQSCPVCEGIVRLMADVSESGSASLPGDAVDELVSQFLDGSEVRRMTFTVYLKLPWSDGADDLNERAASLGESWIDWFDAQVSSPLPNTRSVEPVYRSPQLTAVDETGQTATYSFSVRIEYLQEED